MLPGSIESLGDFVLWVVPGILISSIRSRFLTGKTGGSDPSIRGALAWSVIYAAIAIPAFGAQTLPAEPEREALVRYVLVIFLFPVLLGLTAGVLARLRPAQAVLRKFSVPITDEVPTSWDYAFSDRRGWVRVTLTDGKTVLGEFGGDAFSSTEAGERDLYLPRTAVEDPSTGAWTPQDGHAVLICGGAIRMVEFMPFEEE